MQYKGWILDAVTKVDKISVRCYPPEHSPDTPYLLLDYLYSEVKNYDGAYQRAQHEIDKIELIFSDRK